MLAGIHPLLLDADSIARRELRRHLRGRSLAAVVCILPLMLLVGITLLSGLPRGAGWTSEVPLVIAIVVWSLMVWVVVPRFAGKALAADRRDETWDVLRLSSLHGVGMACGYLFAGITLMVQYSACLAPFVLVTWLSHSSLGLDVIALVILDLHLVGVLAICVAIVSSASAVRRKNGSLPNSGGGLIGLWLIAVLLGIGLIGAGRPSGPPPWMWALRGLVGLACVYHMIKAGMELTHASNDRVSALRGMTFFSLVIVAVMAVTTALPHRGGMALLAILTVLIVIGGTTQPDGLTGKQRQRLTRRGILAGLERILLGPGCQRGWRSALIAMLLAMMIAPHTDAGAMMAAGLICLLILSAVADLIARGLMSGHSQLFHRAVFIFIPILLAGIGKITSLAGYEPAEVLFLPFVIAHVASDGYGDGLGVTLLALGSVSLLYALYRSWPRREPTLHITPDHPGIR